MKKEVVNVETLSLPDEIRKLMNGSKVYESSGYSGAKTLVVGKKDGVYLKIAEKGSLALTAEMQRFFANYGLSSSVILYLSQDRDYLVTEPIAGFNGLDARHLADPYKLSEAYGLSLRYLHGVKTEGCPVTNKMEELVTLVGSSSFVQSHFDILSAYIGQAYSEDAADEIIRKRDLLKNNVLMHGDYCLGNIMLKDWALSGFIDVADGGMGDRHYDLAWGLWTLQYNLKQVKYGHRFLDAYGRQDIEMERLRICGLLSSMV